MKKRLFPSVVFILVLSLVVTGCWDRRELEDRDLVVAMALDKKPSGILTSIQVPIPANIIGSGGAGGGQGQSVQVFSADGQTVGDSLTNMERKLNKSIFLGYLGLLLYGEDQARAGVMESLDLLRRNPEIQRQLFPAVVKGSGEQLLNKGTEMEQIRAEFIENMIQVGIEDKEVIPSTLNRLLVELSTPTRRSPVLNYFGLVDDKYQWLGLAVFRNDRMIDTIDPKEAISLLQLREEQTGHRIILPCPVGKGRVQFRPLKMRRKIFVTEKPTIHIQVDIEGNVTEKTCSHVVEQIEKPKAIGQLAKQQYEQMANRLIRKAQRQWNLDVFDLEDYVASYHHHIYKKMRWDRDFPKIPIDVSYQVYVRRGGSHLR